MYILYIHPPRLGWGVGVWATTSRTGEGEDLIWGQHMEACKDEGIGMNIQGHYQPQGGKGEDLI